MDSSKRRNQHINPARTTENTASFWHKKVVFIRTGVSHHSLSSLLPTTSVKLFPQLSWSWPLHQAVNTSPQHPRRSGLPAKNSSYINGVLGKQSAISLWTQNLLFMYYPYWSTSSSCCAPGRLSLGFILIGIFLWGKRFLQPSPVFNHSPLAYFLQAQGFSFNKSFFFFLSSSIHFPQNIKVTSSKGSVMTFLKKYTSQNLRNTILYISCFFPTCSFSVSISWDDTPWPTNKTYVALLGQAFSSWHAP